MTTKKELELQLQEHRNEITRLCLKNKQLTQEISVLTAQNQLLGKQAEDAERARVAAEFDAGRVPELQALVDVRKDEILRLRAELELKETITNATGDFISGIGSLMSAMREQITASRNGAN
jgi:hypothetical protein